MFELLKLTTYLSCLVAGYFSYTGAISWWWVVVGVSVTVAFKFLAKPSEPPPQIFEKLNDKKEIFDGPSEFKLDIAREIIMEFGQVMMKVNYLEYIYDVSELPMEKEKILDAFLLLYYKESIHKKKERFKLGMMALSHFRENIGEEPIKISLDPELYAATKEEYIKNCLELEGT